ncbi:MAG: hypothetical protein HY650_04540 [Acidobacteria bacterium]|nr:hypothetical protein [Acidobacteriota bacterium]
MKREKGAGNINHFSNPAAVFFLVEFNPKNHENLCAAILPFRHRESNKLAVLSFGCVHNGLALSRH